MNSFLKATFKYIRQSDMLLLFLCAAATVFGIVLISSTTRTEGGNYVAVQVIALVLGIALYVFFSLIDIDIIAGKSQLLYILSALLICTLFLWGEAGDSGNRAWIRFGIIGIQPAEFVKIPLIIIIAQMINTYKDRRTLTSPLSVLKLAAVFGFLFVLILVSSADLGSALVYVFVFAVVLFVGGVQLRWFVIAIGLVAAASPFIWNRFLSDYQRNRILAPYDPSVDATGLDILWQTNVSKSAIANGGIFGQGLYKGSMTQADIVPQQHTDFIFSAAGEELGFAGCLVILLLLLAIIGRCIYVGVKSNNTLGALVCSGIAAMLIAQTFENVGMCLGLTPVIGLTLPFFSYGGSSIITLFAAMGIVSGIKMRPKPARFGTYR